MDHQVRAASRQDCHLFFTRAWKNAKMGPIDTEVMGMPTTREGGAEIRGA
jgi:hypothetical protein